MEVTRAVTTGAVSSGAVSLEDGNNGAYDDVVE